MFFFPHAIQTLSVRQTWSTLKANCVRPALWLCETWHFDSSPDLVSFTPMSQEKNW